MSDEPREVSALFRDVAGNGRLDESSSADFRTALRELVEEGRRLLEASDEKSPA